MRLRSPNFDEAVIAARCSFFVHPMELVKQQVYWSSQRPRAVAPQLQGNTQADVVVVGGGIAALSCAQRLLAEEVSVVVVEKDFCGSGASGKSSGFVTPASEIELASLISRFGPVEAERLWGFVVSGVEAIRANIRTHGFDCDYQAQDSLFVARGRSGWKAVQEEHDARVRLGFRSHIYGNNEMRQVLGTARYVGAVRYGGTFGINPYLYCLALHRLLVARGVRIFENSEVTQVRRDGVTTPRGTVRAGNVVVCTDRFIPNMGALKKEIYHVQTFLGVSKPLKEADIHAMFPSGDAMVWDSDLVYSYFRRTGENRVILGGGDLLHTYARSPVNDMTRFAKRLTDHFRSLFPEISIELEFTWPGMLGVSKDLLPVMSKDRMHDTISYAGAATGLPWAAALGAYAAERVLHNRNDFDDAFSPDRRFVIGSRLQSLISTPMAYAISNGVAKYR